MNRLINDLNTAHSVMGNALFINTIEAIREKPTLKSQIRFGRMYTGFMGLNWYQQKAVILFACRHKGHWLKNNHIE